ncbi:MAG: hypothetical protein F6K30_08785 [Cyanothece sp. SIO2G6]|nr:hypothetical protein [Cyanothece sp. SIO2G6]
MLATWGRCSVGWYFNSKLHLNYNDRRDATMDSKDMGEIFRSMSGTGKSYRVNRTRFSTQTSS